MSGPFFDCSDAIDSGIVHNRLPMGTHAIVPQDSCVEPVVWSLVPHKDQSVPKYGWEITQIQIHSWDMLGPRQKWWVSMNFHEPGG